MLKVPKPTMSSEKVYADCISTFRAELRQRLEACAPLIANAEEELNLKLGIGQVHTISRETTVNGNVTAEELKKVYVDKMVKHKTGQVYYNELKQATKHNVCPLCAHRDVSTLDHYLPKADYPILSVVPINLIPSCKDCNTGKLHRYPRKPEEQTIHPYFDDIENDIWLMATVNQTRPVSVSFQVVKPLHWTDLLFERVKGHFDSFKLNTLYATQAGRELSGRKLMLTQTFDGGAGKNGVRWLLEDEASSREDVNKNSWQAALCRGLAGDDWFCGEGFRYIGI